MQIQSDDLDNSDRMKLLIILEFQLALFRPSYIKNIDLCSCSTNLHPFLATVLKRLDFSFLSVDLIFHIETQAVWISLSQRSHSCYAKLRVGIPGHAPVANFSFHNLRLHLHLYFTRSIAQGVHDAFARIIMQRYKHSVCQKLFGLKLTEQMM